MTEKTLTALDFERVDKKNQEADKLVRPSLTYWKDALRRFKKNKAACIALTLIVIMILLAIFVPMFSPFTYRQQNYAAINVSPNATYWFGTDELGRDIFVRSWEGARVSLSIAFIVVFLNTFVGIIYGGISGYFGGRVDNLMMRIVEIISSVPSMLWMIIMSLIMQQGVTSLIIALCATGWCGMARLFRGQVLQLREMEYVQVSRTLGANSMWIIFKHLFPNALSPIITNVAFAIPGAIFAEASLSYIGLGLPMPMASWGILSSEGAAKILLYPYQLLWPSLLICITMLSFNVIGDGLRDALDPKLRNQ